MSKILHPREMRSRLPAKLTGGTGERSANGDCQGEGDGDGAGRCRRRRCRCRCRCRYELPATVVVNNISNTNTNSNSDNRSNSHQSQQKQYPNPHRQQHRRHRLYRNNNISAPDSPQPLLVINLLIAQSIIIILTTATSPVQAASGGVSRPATGVTAGVKAIAGSLRDQASADRESSSSMFAEIEDLTDSSIKTRLGTVNNSDSSGSGGGSDIAGAATTANTITNDFGRLLDIILADYFRTNANSQQQQQQQQHKADTKSASSANHLWSSLTGADRTSSQHIGKADLTSSLSASPSPFPSPSSSPRWTTHADKNNRTTMRFFRNNKTFASIVYTGKDFYGGADQKDDNDNDDDNNNSNSNSNRRAGRKQHAYAHDQGDGQKRPAPARLINCHLVDLEKHSSDVLLFESKYDIKTMDIEFSHMMQLIDACTEVARLRKPTQLQLLQQYRRRTDGHQQLIVQKPASANLPQRGWSRPAAGAGAGGVSSSGQPSLATFQSVMSGALHNELQQLDSSALNNSNNTASKLALPTSAPSTTGAASRARQVARKRSLQVGSRDKLGHAQQQRDFQQQARALFAEAAAQVRADWARAHLAAFGPGAGDNAGHNGVARGRQMNAPPLLPAHRTDNGHNNNNNNNRHGQVHERHRHNRHNNNNNSDIIVVDNGQHANSTNGLREALAEITNYDTSDLMAVWRGILPGTNWCGMGDRATSYNDLGFESDIDICCRAHDFCPIRLPAFTSGYGLFNWSFYTRSHCLCDQNFLDCLQKANSPLSGVVMRFYFTIMKTTCLNDSETKTNTTALMHNSNRNNSNSNNNSHNNSNNKTSGARHWQSSLQSSLANANRHHNLYGVGQLAHHLYGGNSSRLSAGTAAAAAHQGAAQVHGQRHGPDRLHRIADTRTPYIPAMRHSVPIVRNDNSNNVNDHNV